MKGFVFGALVGAILTLFGLGQLVKINTPFDDTDPPNGRSGMRLHIDNRTGCHYLATARGGMTPRLGKDGKQLCDKLDA